jgi:pimeloyl-ACP methyl ester carboxylesterase
MNLLALLVLLIAAPQASPPVPPPGKLVDIGGWRLHLNCTGRASDTQPTVILEAGAGSFSVDWSLVQPEASRFARVCSYDRAGMGWSELGPHPRTLHQIVWELHTVLDKSGIRPPYLFVGHSYGGILSRLYALTYPSEVLGMVLVDSGYEGGVVVLQNGAPVRLADKAAGKPIPAVQTSNPLHESDIPPAVVKQIEAAARQMAPHATEPPYNKLPDEDQRMRSWAFAQVKHWATNDNPFEADELASLLEIQKQKHPLGNILLLVLTRGMWEDERPQAKEVEEEHLKNQTALLNLSGNSKQVIAHHSRHEIMIYEPDVVLAAIRDVLIKVKR